MCLDLVNCNHIYPFEKLNIPQSACICFNLLSLMTTLSGAYGFPGPFAITPQPWNLETIAMNIKQNHSCSEWWKYGC